MIRVSVRLSLPILVFIRTFHLSMNDINFFFEKPNICVVRHTIICRSCIWAVYSLRSSFIYSRNLTYLSLIFLVHWCTLIHIWITRRFSPSSGPLMIYMENIFRLICDASTTHFYKLLCTFVSSPLIIHVCIRRQYLSVYLFRIYLVKNNVIHF